MVINTRHLTPCTEFWLLLPWSLQCGLACIGRLFGFPLNYIIIGNTQGFFFFFQPAQVRTFVSCFKFCNIIRVDFNLLFGSGITPILIQSIAVLYIIHISKIFFSHQFLLEEVVVVSIKNFYSLPQWNDAVQVVFISILSISTLLPPLSFLLDVGSLAFSAAYWDILSAVSQFD